MESSKKKLVRWIQQSGAGKRWNASDGPFSLFRFFFAFFSCCCELSAALDSWWPQQNLCNKHHIHKLSLKAGKLLFQKKSHQSKSFLRSASDQGGAQEGPFAVTTGPVLTHVVADGFSSDYSFFCASLTDQFKLGQSLLHHLLDLIQGSICCTLNHTWNWFRLKYWPTFWYLNKTTKLPRVFNFVFAKISATTEITEIHEISPNFFLRLAHKICFF